MGIWKGSNFANSKQWNEYFRYFLIIYLHSCFFYCNILLLICIEKLLKLIASVKYPTNIVVYQENIINKRE